MQEGTAAARGRKDGDIIIQYLLAQGTDSTHDMRVANTDAVTYQSKNPEKCIYTADQEKKKKYLPACIKERRNFTPFVASVDGLIRVEVEATLKCLSSRLAKKWKEPYSHTCS